MQIFLPTDQIIHYKSNSQRARVATESWARKNLYCPSCDSSSLAATRRNTPSLDYQCPKCQSRFELKAQSRNFAGRIVDAAYSAMIGAIQEGRTPNLFAMHYEPSTWKVVNLLLIPRFAFSLSAIEKRPPLAPTARRAGWVGCNILLHAIPLDARIGVIINGNPSSKEGVRQQYARMRPLERLQTDQRGWTLDVLNAIRSLRRREFILNDVYEKEEQLSWLHPANKHVKDKIRQQLQIIRDLGLLEFLGHGRYRLKQLETTPV